MPRPDPYRERDIGEDWFRDYHIRMVEAYLPLLSAQVRDELLARYGYVPVDDAGQWRNGRRPARRSGSR